MKKHIGLNRDEHADLVHRIRHALGDDAQLSFGKAFVTSGGDLFRVVVRSRGYIRTIGDFDEELEAHGLDDVDLKLIDFQYVDDVVKRED